MKKMNQLELRNEYTTHNLFIISIIIYFKPIPYIQWLGKAWSNIHLYFICSTPHPFLFDNPTISSFDHNFLCI